MSLPKKKAISDSIALYRGRNEGALRRNRGINQMKYIAKSGTLMPNKGYYELVQLQARSRTALLAEQAGAARLSHHCLFIATLKP